MQVELSDTQHQHKGLKEWVLRRRWHEGKSVASGATADHHRDSASNDEGNMPSKVLILLGLYEISIAFEFFFCRSHGKEIVGTYLKMPKNVFDFVTE